MVDYVFNPELPKHAELKSVVNFLNEKSVNDINELKNKIKEQTGNPQDMVDWSEPDKWIPERLDGRSQELATELWKDSESQANPRYLSIAEKSAEWLNLLGKDDNYYVTAEGKKFVAGETSATITVDKREGIDFILKKIEKEESCKTSDLLPSWTNFLKENESRMKADGLIKYSLRRRLANLFRRDLVQRERLFYSLTTEGEKYLRNFITKPKKQQKQSDKVLVEELEDEEINEQQIITDTIDAYNQSIVEDFRKKMLKMHPKKFEEFIGNLIRKMGYNVKVKVTDYVGDRGIDLVVTNSTGFHEFIEVFQIKRKEAAISHASINELRGAMDTYHASLGVFVTLGKFTKPTSEEVDKHNESQIKKIRLVDGQKLLELIEKYEVGIKKINTSYEIYEIDYEVFE